MRKMLAATAAITALASVGADDIPWTFDTSNHPAASFGAWARRQAKRVARPADARRLTSSSVTGPVKPL